MPFHFSEGETLLINKPLHWTSYDVVRKVKKHIDLYCGEKIKVGHAGTLDPLASGLLIICTGKKTKEISKFQEFYKVYEGGMMLGATTPSFDMETEVDKTFPVDNLTPLLINQAVNKFLGEIEQMPPEYSALKVGGERSYDRARKGKINLLQSRTVSIYEFDIIEIKMPVVNFRVKCSKGTYIRSLVHDFGKVLNNGACLSWLKRTDIGEFALRDAKTIDEFIYELN